MNRSKELRKLFRESLKRKSSSFVSYGSSGYISRDSSYYQKEIEFPRNISIYFYEWSNIKSSPRCFYNIDIFEKFLKDCGIKMELYHRDIIKNVGKVYASCLTGTTTLVIRGSYKNLSDCMNEHDRKHLLNGISSSCNRSIIMAPKLILEDKNTRFDSDGTFFG